jgi:hypothetical protein
MMCVCVLYVIFSFSKRRGLRALFEVFLVFLFLLFLLDYSRC